MAKRRKHKPAPARTADKPLRAPKRGMYLEVVITDRNGFMLPVRLESFRDITTVGHRVAGRVREYLRSIPLMPHVGAYTLALYPRWIETAPPPVRNTGAGAPGSDGDD